MSTGIDKCDFCGDEIISGSVNSETMGYTIAGGVFTNDLRLNNEGPHICAGCVSAINHGTFKHE